MPPRHASFLHAQKGVCDLLGRDYHSDIHAHADIDGVFFSLQCDSGAFVTSEFSSEFELQRFIVDYNTFMATYDLKLQKVIVTIDDKTIVHCSSFDTPVFMDSVIEQFRLALFVEMFDL